MKRWMLCWLWACASLVWGTPTDCGSTGESLDRYVALRFPGCAYHGNVLSNFSYYTAFDGTESSDVNVGLTTEHTSSGWTRHTLTLTGPWWRTFVVGFTISGASIPSMVTDTLVFDITAPRPAEGLQPILWSWVGTIGNSKTWATAFLVPGGGRVSSLSVSWQDGTQDGAQTPDVATLLPVGAGLLWLWNKRRRLSSTAAC